MKNLKLPVGIEDFQEIRRNGFYYIDKTGLIEQLLDSWGKVNLFTRPCRFGKSLNMSMLRYFFEIGTDKTLFDGLHILQRKDLCDEYMGRFPVVFLTLKGVDGLTFEKAKNKLIKIVALEAERFIFLKNSDKLTDNEKQRYCALVQMQDGKYAMDEDTLESALQTLSELLYRHYGHKVVILVDEYDVPLDKAYQNGYYKEMVSMIRSLFGEALKTNEFLQFAVLTGCLRKSNVEAGEGFADIIIKPQNPDDGIIFELKCSKEASGLDKACERAIKQIRDRRYSEYLKNDGRHNMIFYGIAFYKKRCKVVVDKLN